MLLFIKMNLMKVKGVFAAARDITEMKKIRKRFKRIYQDTLEEKVAINELKNLANPRTDSNNLLI